MAATMKAALVKEAGDWNTTVYDGEIPKPAVREGHVLVRVKAAAFNPMDWKIAMTGFFIQQWPTILGFDYCGVVQEVGEGVMGLEVGDEVFGSPMGASFAEWVVVPQLRACKKPKNLTFQQASTLGVGGRTAIVSLFQEIGLNLHRISAKHTFTTPEWVLIMGGTTSTGLYAIQLAKLAGYSVIATGSKKNHEYLKSLGATHTIDYSLPPAEQISTIQSLTDNKLAYALDCVGPETSKIAAQALSTSVPKATLTTIANNRHTVEFPSHVTVKEISGFAPEDQEDLKRSWETEVVPAIEGGLVKANEVVLLEEGSLAANVKKGLTLLKEGKVSAAKLVVQP
ncbi:hypothetical protein HDV00_009213 [Rhizophlyctis rosea]|nr:hypothetical protein HDV00_009213 [Rhizophlyctis rosea]